MLTFRLKKQAIDVMVEHYINTRKVMTYGEFAPVWRKMGNLGVSAYYTAIEQLRALVPEIEEYLANNK